MIENFNLLELAVERNTAITLTVPQGGLTKNYRSRLLELSSEGVLIELVAELSDKINDLIKSQETVKISFRSDVRKVEFESPIVHTVRGHKLNSSTKIDTLLIKLPQEITAVQRRSDYRTTVPSDGEIKISFWRIGEKDDLSIAPPESSRVMIDVRDCSAGGIGGTWKRKTTDPNTLINNQRLRIDIDSPVGKCTLEGRLRFLENLKDQFFKRVGVQFVINQSSVPDRQKVVYLGKLLTELQRMELKRKRIAR